MRTLKRGIARLLRQCGYELLKFDARNHGEFALRWLIDQSGIDCVLDVGANRGQFGIELREAGIQTTLVSFEPLIDAYEQLERVADCDERWVVAPRMALGSEPGEVEMNIAGNSVSSSILPMTDLHASAAPGSGMVSKAIVPVSTLSEEFNKNGGWGGGRYLLKIDTQGYEPEVLAGANDVMDKIYVLNCELSCDTLYEGQKLFPEVMSDILDRGFEIFRLEPEFVDRKTGQTYQLNGTFLNMSLF
jgi:FkbM family methyltransferase